MRPEALSVGRPRIHVPERASRDSRGDGSLCINPRDHSMENLQFIHSSLDYTHAQTLSNARTVSYERQASLNLHKIVSEHLLGALHVEILNFPPVD